MNVKTPPLKSLLDRSFARLEENEMQEPLREHLVASQRICGSSHPSLLISRNVLNSALIYVRKAGLVNNVVLNLHLVAFSRTAVG